MLRSKYVVGLILAATLMATLVLFSAMVYAQDQEKDKAEEFLALAEQSKEQVKILIETVEAQEDIEVPPEALTLNKTGSELLEQARTAFDEGRYEEAIDLVEEALENFREAIKVLNKALEPIVEEESKAESEHSALGEAINRAYERIARIKDANNTYFSMYDWDESQPFGEWIRGNLSAAETNLEDAEAALDIPNVEWAAGNLTEANHNISDAFAALRELGSWTNAWRIESFLRGIKNSYERTLELLKKREVPPDDTIVGYIEGNITEARDHMIAAMQKWNDGDKDSAKTERREAIEHLRVVRDLLRQLRPGGSKKGFD